MMSKFLYKETSLLEEASGCLLCNEAPCTNACPHQLEIDKIIRCFRFDNKAGAINRLPLNSPCQSCTDTPCVTACLKGKVGTPVPIPDMFEKLSTYEKTTMKEVDLSIDFCGVSCENPFFLSSSVVGSN